MSAANPFPVYCEDDWRKAASAALKGAPLEKLVSKTSDGIAFGPIHSPAEGPRLLREPGPWKALARVDHPEPGEANVAALEDLANGADGLQIVFAGAAGAYGYGLAHTDAAGLDRTFDGVRFDVGARFELDLGPGGGAEAVAALILRSGANPGMVDIAFGMDPIGLRLRSGRAFAPWGEEAKALAASAARLSAQGFAGPFAAADGRPVHAAGGTPAQELGFALACAAVYARALEEGGFSSKAACAGVSFRLAADADQFVTLAKFRALRLLWASVLETAGLPPRPARLHAESAWRTMSARDPFVNVMRGALAGFSAGVGGADSVALLPFSRAIGLPDAFARRLARNTQLIETAEAHLGFVEDPAAGAGLFETLTKSLCEKAWAIFQDFESAGNAAEALATGKFQASVREAASAMARDVARLKTPITGVTAHPDLGENRIEVRPATAPAFEFPGEPFAPGLAPIRIAERFERLRDAAEAASERPSVFLAAIDSPAAHARRVAFAREFFEIGGVETKTGTALDASRCAELFRASDARAACLCGADEGYAAHAEIFARALKDAGADYVLLAGRPGEREAALRSAGVDDFIFAGQDVLAFLTSFLQRAHVIPKQAGVQAAGRAVTPGSPLARE